MQLTIIKNIDEIQLIADEWNDLLQCCSASHVPFLRNEFLSAWWKTLGGGEWSQGELFTVVARNENGQLVAIAPLFFTKNRQGNLALMLLGSIEISDYLDIIAQPSELAAFVENLFELIGSNQAPPWKIMDLYNLPEETPTLLSLQASAEKHGWLFEKQRLQQCPYIPLPGDWETYLAGIVKKQRHEIRRKMRRAENYNPPVRWYIVQDQEKLDTEFDVFLALMAQDPEKEKFLTPLMRTQMRSVVHAAFQAGWLQLAFLEVAGEKAAGYLNFDFAGHIWVYNSGLNFEFRDLSPGWVLLGHLLKWAIDNGRQSFDFMRGDEDYKYRFGAIDQFIVRATITRP